MSERHQDSDDLFKPTFKVSNLGRKGKVRLVASFKPVSGNPAKIYSLKACEGLLKNPPAGFSGRDRKTVQRAIDQLKATEAELGRFLPKRVRNKRLAFHGLRR